MAITVRIRVNLAERNMGGWSVSFGHDCSFTYCENYTCKTMDDLSTYLTEVARLVATDPRQSNWPGLRVAAENKGARKPSGWDQRRKDREVYVAIVGNKVDAA